MARSVDDARRDLREFVDRPFRSAPPIPLTTPGLETAPMRRSSVLILFGALDRVPAAGLEDPSEAPPGPVPPELDVLLTRRGDTLRHHAGEVAFPGGGEEPGDADPAATALREACEETALDPAGVEILGALPPVPIPVSRNLVTPVIGWWRLPSEVAADHRESVEVFRVPVAELLDPAARVTSVLRRGSLTHRGPAFLLSDRLGGHLVWGFTGILLSTIFDELGWTIPWEPGPEHPVTGRAVGQP